MPLAFLSGPYSGRMVNDIEGPRIAAHVSRRYGVEADYFVGFAGLELGRTVRVRDREMALVKRRGAGDEHSFAVWSDLYVTDSMEHVAAALDSDDAKTRELARAFCEGHVLGVSAWPGRELCENDKAHVVDKANAHALRATLGLSAGDAALLQQAAPAAFAIGGDAATIEKLCDERERWVVKARFGCGGSSVIVGTKPSWPTQSLPRVVAEAGERHTARVAIGEIARDAGVPLDLDDEGRIAQASWVALWPHLVRYAASSPGHYVAQARVEPAPFHAMVYDGHRVESFDATTDFAAAFTLGWRGDGPHLAHERHALPRGARRASAHQHHDARRAAAGHVRGRVRPPLRGARSPPRPRGGAGAGRGAAIARRRCPPDAAPSYDGPAMSRPARPSLTAAAPRSPRPACCSRSSARRSPRRSIDPRLAGPRVPRPPRGRREGATADAVLPYLSANYRRVVSNLPKAERDAWLARVKRVPPAPAKLQAQAQAGDRCTLGVVVRDASHVKWSGRVEMVREGGAWKLADESWTTEVAMTADVARWLYRIARTKPGRRRSARTRTTRSSTRGPLRLLIERNGAITVTRGYTWNGCSPKVFVLDLLFGTPEGVVNARTGQRKTYYASMVHDALYQFLADGLPLTRVQADRCFLLLMRESSFLLAPLYWLVRARLRRDRALRDATLAGLERHRDASRATRSRAAARRRR